MRLVKIFGIILINLVLVYFLAQNAGEKVDLNLLFLSYENVPVFLIILFSLSIGILSGFLSAVIVVLSLKSQTRSLKDKNRLLTDELNDLRNVAIDEGIYDTEDGDL
ncbi:MAG: LapA family protein [Candidatus Marinimicrobia bacterium]|jgi:uncharacterized integral membrane protein|nr:LapA family protein [Candidatus Neomarinimicrobiota bacterium]|tara:strand:- start:1988 stop:2308 length:321 start_codon:yes stop_codon:yes gene_type:complete